MAEKKKAKEAKVTGVTGKDVEVKKKVTRKKTAPQVEDEGAVAEAVHDMGVPATRHIEGISAPQVTHKSSGSAGYGDNDDAIFIKGARMHNLKNVDVAIPRNKLVVVTGVSGSGKSSLTMDTLFAEGQRRYAESLSAYARQFLMRMDKPDVDYIRGICPAIAIEQKVTTRTPRSTVGSMTEIYDYLRLLFARIGRTFSPVSGKEVKKDTVTDVVEFIETLPVNTKVQFIVPLITRYGRSVNEELNILMQKGFSRVYAPDADDKPIRIEDVLNGERELPAKHLYLLIDRIVVKEQFEEDDLHRMADSIQTGFYESEGECLVETDGKQLHVFNNRFEAD